MKPALDADTLWRLARVGGLTLSPDARQVVCAVNQPDMEANRSRTQLWRLAAQGAAALRAQPFTLGEHDSAPAFSPCGRFLAFTGRRAPGGGALDATPQLYLMPADGGEAWRLTDFAPGVGAFRWVSDHGAEPCAEPRAEPRAAPRAAPRADRRGNRCGLIFVAWVWPELASVPAQHQRFRQQAQDQAQGLGTAAATSEMQYRHFGSVLPAGREPHLLHLALDKHGQAGRLRDVLHGTGLALPRADPGLAHFAVHPDGQRVAVVHDPAPVKRAGACCAISEVRLRAQPGQPRVRTLLQQDGWHFQAPAYRPDGGLLACTAAQRGLQHTAPQRLATLALRPGAHWALAQPAAWDHEVDAPLRWQGDGQALWFTAQQQGRCLLWRHAVDSGATEPMTTAGWVHGFALAGDTLVTVQDSAAHPPRVLAYPLAPGGRLQAPRRLEAFNDALLDTVALGEVQPFSVVGALGDSVQSWLVFAPGFKPRRRHALMHVIHGGPHAAAGDTWSWRWNPHVLAGRGAVVVQVNYHGSSGFGQAFKHSLIGRQGQLELQDIEAVTDHLLRQPWVDARRVFATGGSYGGFLVAWMNGMVRYDAAQPRYRAYVCHAGVFDRAATLSADSYLQRPLDLGAPSAAAFLDDLPRVLAQSPLALAGAMHTPTLVIHGAQDFRVPDCNGLAYYNTLKARGVPARLLWFPDEHHWVLKPRNSRQWYGEFLDWIDAHDVPPRRR